MSWVTTSGMRGMLARTALAGGIVGAAAMAAAVPANAAPSFAKDDPACEWLGWRHPLCGGGAFESPADDGIPGDNAAIGGIPAPAMVPNVDGSLSLAGTPGAV